ncbi:hypothetical protein HGM15179_009033, partial [Zosterops borbonicus]
QKNQAWTTRRLSTYAILKAAGSDQNGGREGKKFHGLRFPVSLLKSRLKTLCLFICSSYKNSFTLLCIFCSAFPMTRLLDCLKK